MMACRMADVSSQLVKLNEEADSLTKQINELYEDKKKEADQDEEADIQTRIDYLKQKEKDILAERAVVSGKLPSGMLLSVLLIITTSPTGLLM